MTAASVILILAAIFLVIISVDSMITRRQIEREIKALDRLLKAIEEERR